MQILNFLRGKFFTPKEAKDLKVEIIKVIDDRTREISVTIPTIEEGRSQSPENNKWIPLNDKPIVIGTIEVDPIEEMKSKNFLLSLNPLFFTEEKQRLIEELKKFKKFAKESGISAKSHKRYWLIQYQTMVVDFVLHDLSSPVPLEYFGSLTRLQYIRKWEGLHPTLGAQPMIEVLKRHAAFCKKLPFK